MNFNNTVMSQEGGLYKNSVLLLCGYWETADECLFQGDETIHVWSLVWIKSSKEGEKKNQILQLGIS